jgi:hypothetical protein
MSSYRRILGEIDAARVRPMGTFPPVAQGFVGCWHCGLEATIRRVPTEPSPLRRMA